MPDIAGDRLDRHGDQQIVDAIGIPNGLHAAGILDQGFPGGDIQPAVLQRLAISALSGELTKVPAEESRAT